MFKETIFADHMGFFLLTTVITRLFFWCIVETQLTLHEFWTLYYVMSRQKMEIEWFFMCYTDVNTPLLQKM